MDKIRCKAGCKKGEGCGRCGGFGIVLEKAKCPKCKKTFWDYPRRGQTVYAGKEIVAFDGTVLVYVWGIGFVHEECSAKKKRKI